MCVLCMHLTSPLSSLRWTRFYSSSSTSSSFSSWTSFSVVVCACRYQSRHTRKQRAPNRCWSSFALVLPASKRTYTRTPSSTTTTTTTATAARHGRQHVLHGCRCWVWCCCLTSQAMIFSTSHFPFSSALKASIRHFSFLDKLGCAENSKQT